ncbi:S46 family peptidase [Solimonas variicoloris]|uniref:S46 family peptidase n=1 Tax=Solimonas variicoloris TaxID=254408 RepID=UPI00037A2F03|nr:S46 family peptidase [Solimonas variicoloris]
MIFRHPQAWLAAALSLCTVSASAAEGMWTLDNLPRAQLKARYGFEPDAKWVDHVMKASVRLAGGCSGSFVSKDGLVLTNAHCVLDCVQNLSGEKDRVNEGFVARKREEELACPSVELNRLEQITDVSARIAKATAGKTGQAYVEAKQAAQAAIESECTGRDAAHTRCDIVELYNGGQYGLYRYHRFQDVRLVFSPEYQAAFFGGDPDNFNFPRYNLDMGLLRAYENGKPAKIKDYFPLNTAGAAVGELTMVTGHPGSTERQLTVAQLEALRDYRLFDGALYYAERRAMLSQYSRIGDEAARQAQTDLTYTENSLKVYRGELEALHDPAVFERKRDEEAVLRAAAASTAPWDEIARAETVLRNHYARYQMLEGKRAPLAFFSEHFRIARALVRHAEEMRKPNEARLPEFQDAALPTLEQRVMSKAPIYPEYEKAKLTWSLTKLREAVGPDDALVKLVLGKQSPDELARDLIDGSKLADPAVRRALWDGGAAAIAASNDPFIRLARAVDAPARAERKTLEAEVEGPESRAAEAIAKVRFAKLGTSVYPDATFTLRFSYGEVKGWDEDGTPVPPFTDLAGAFARQTGRDPFELPKTWNAARDRLDLATPYNFVTTNDIIGGNSGSPIINRKAEIVGLAFDGNAHSHGGAFWFDDKLNRCVAVHPAAIAEALDKIYGAPGLLKEMQGR